MRIAIWSIALFIFGCVGVVRWDASRVGKTTYRCELQTMPGEYLATAEQVVSDSWLIILQRDETEIAVNRSTVKFCEPAEVEG